jgi:pyridoxamine 5'-phosphate oxidase
VNRDPEQPENGDRTLEIEDLKKNPIELFREWLAEADRSGIPEANGVCLSTIGEDGFPDSRMVLLKGIEDEALRFYTNYESNKGRQLSETGKAAMVFWWQALRRQVRFIGRVEKLTPEESDAYFASRPRDSQLGAWASAQSRPIESREELGSRLLEVEQRFKDSVPRPPHWGGFKLTPHRAEFWQGRTSRLHDRFVFEREETSWLCQRLMP